MRTDSVETVDIGPFSINICLNKIEEGLNERFQKRRFCRLQGDATEE